MSPIYPIDSYSEFTYDNLSEIRSEPFWTGVAALLVAGVAAVVTLASDGQPVQAGVPSEAAIYASVDDGAIVNDVVHAEP